MDRICDKLIKHDRKKRDELIVSYVRTTIHLVERILDYARQDMFYGVPLGEFVPDEKFVSVKKEDEKRFAQVLFSKNERKRLLIQSLLEVSGRIQDSEQIQKISAVIKTLQKEGIDILFYHESENEEDKFICYDIVIGQDNEDALTPSRKVKDFVAKQIVSLKSYPKPSPL